MGYETTLLFVNTYGKKGGYRNVKASLEMNKIAYDESIQNLIESIKHKQGTTDERAKLHKAVKDYENLHKEIYTDEGEHTKTMEEMNSDEQGKMIDKLFQKEKQLGRKIPFVYWLEGNTESFTDCYGDLLLETTLAELKKAIFIANAKEIAENNATYRAYDIALDIIKNFEDDKHTKVILYGH